MKKCGKCGESKPIDDFYLNGKYIRSICKQCDRARAKAYNQSHPEKRKEWARNWAAEHPERIAEYRRREALNRGRLTSRKGKPTQRKLNPWLQNHVDALKRLIGSAEGK